MSSNFVEYTVYTNQPVESGELKFEGEKIHKITIKYQELNEQEHNPQGKVIIKCYHDISDLQVAQKVAKEKIHILLGMICFQYNTIFGEPIFIRSQIGSHHTDSASLHGKIIVRSKIITIEQIKKMIDGTPNASNSYTQYLIMYKDALKNDDPISKFMSLYGLLSLTIEGRQKNVDDFITNEYKEKNTQVKKRATTKPGKNYKETIFTWLRNQIAHPKEDTDINEVKDEMVAHLEELMCITRKAIENKFSGLK